MAPADSPVQRANPGASSVFEEDLKFSGSSCDIGVEHGADVEEFWHVPGKLGRESRELSCRGALQKSVISSEIPP